MKDGINFFLLTYGGLIHFFILSPDIWRMGTFLPPKSWLVEDGIHFFFLVLTYGAWINFFLLSPDLWRMEYISSPWVLTYGGWNTYLPLESWHMEDGIHFFLLSPDIWRMEYISSSWVLTYRGWNTFLPLESWHIEHGIHYPDISSMEYCTLYWLIEDGIHFFLLSPDLWRTSFFHLESTHWIWNTFLPHESWLMEYPGRGHI